MNSIILNDYEQFLKQCYQEDIFIYNKDELLNNYTDKIRVYTELIKSAYYSDSSEDSKDYFHYSTKYTKSEIEPSDYMIYKDELNLIYKIKMYQYEFYIIQDLTKNKYKVQFDNVIFNGFDEQLFNFIIEHNTTF